MWGKERVVTIIIIIGYKIKCRPVKDITFHMIDIYYFMHVVKYMKMLRFEGG